MLARPTKKCHEPPDAGQHGSGGGGGAGQHGGGVGGAGQHGGGGGGQHLGLQHFFFLQHCAIDEGIKRTKSNNILPRIFQVALFGARAFIAAAGNLKTDQL